MNKTIKRLLVTVLLVTLLIPATAFGQFGNNSSSTSKSKASEENNNRPHMEFQGDAPQFTEASVHDPSVIKVGDTFYVFGSHLAAAKTDDLMNWEQISTHVHDGNPLIPNVFTELAEAFEWANTTTLWAADVIQLEDGRFYMYYNACEGTSPRSALGVAVADDIEGPYEDLGIFLKSGMWGQESPDGTIYNANIHPNAIDPENFFDKDGNLWMVYGSYSGGIFILEMDRETGFPKPDQGYGTHLMGGNHSRMEGAYIEYNAETDFYYLYVTFGGLDAAGGYNMRVARSENPDGPYYDAEGNLMSEVRGAPGTFFDDRSIEPYGVKQMGNFLFKRELGEPGTGIGHGYVSPGHNSVYTDEETGQMFMFFHTRFPERGEQHEIRVHQMFMNKDGWPVIAPYRYAGEELEKVNRQDVIGDYKFINHGKDISAEIKESVHITLEKNNKISGEVNGTWKTTGHNQVELIIDGSVYNGVFVRQWEPTSESYVMAFTALSKEGVAVWGSKLENKTNEEIVEAVYKELNFDETIISNLSLPTKATRNTKITWETSNSDIISETGVVNRPEAVTGDQEVTLTATITKDEVTKSKSFTIVVLAQGEGQLVAHYNFNDNLENHAENVSFGPGTVTGNRIDNEGGTITFTDGVKGKAAVFDGSSGIRLPNGLITSHTYTVSLWLNPDQLTDFTTSFFGARTPDRWVSLVPRGGGFANYDTMVWSGTAWYDAPTGMKIPTGEWTHIAFTVDEGKITVYVNGEERFTGTGFPNVFTTADAYFGLGVNHWDTPYKGLMDELKIYDNLALTAEEIVLLANRDE
ncbi:arabinan endo-1,5-alpha-L-arabinosidase [Evansella vedderi]|uniref:Arabinan endo-1,5-alpha-L-arabinosidase n=1 Tax=Evansella vedderi TaxID=38282 RepID=A0ABT9ZXU3_9BACI|nr:glycoside hydrolase family 43 C-terminal domain-containing protein [Evansella vedderi]MDQ0256054.1 arabinan endo-1,5-alpha-L-arabinosidase [Evansella vedderi]